MDEILSTYEIQLIVEDYHRLESSSYCTLYKELKPKHKTENMKSNTSSYILLAGPIDRTRVIAQIRLVGNTKVNFFLNKMGYNWNSDEECNICNLHENENLHHFLFKCPHFSSVRNCYLKKWLSDSQCSVRNIVENPSRLDINNVYFYVQAALKIRAFLRNE
uniref:Reverse transcriptase zinc-binding domain-containing protein n=1 Tax=Cacopsylla melanoneura TaxID=428564 RepID=A0A8D8ZRE6_9HEMI